MYAKPERKTRAWHDAREEGDLDPLEMEDLEDLEGIEFSPLEVLYVAVLTGEKLSES